jgi:hypothetical protein
MIMKCRCTAELAFLFTLETTMPLSAFFLTRNFTLFQLRCSQEWVTIQPKYNNYFRGLILVEKLARLLERGVLYIK